MVSVPFIDSFGFMLRPTPCTRRPDSFDREFFQIVASGALIRFSMLSLLTVSGINTWLAYCVPVDCTLWARKPLRQEHAKWLFVFYGFFILV